MKDQTHIVLSKNGLTLMVRIKEFGLTYTFNSSVIPYREIRQRRRLMIKQLVKKVSEAAQK